MPYPSGPRVAWPSQANVDVTARNCSSSPVLMSILAASTAIDGQDRIRLMSTDVRLPATSDVVLPPSLCIRVGYVVRSADVPLTPLLPYISSTERFQAAPKAPQP